jgi:hypothetical protein
MKASKLTYALTTALSLLAAQACVMEAPPEESTEESGGFEHVGEAESELMRPTFPGGFSAPSVKTEWLDCGDPANSECVECKYPDGDVGDGVACCLTSNCVPIPK